MMRSLDGGALVLVILLFGCGDLQAGSAEPYIAALAGEVVDQTGAAVVSDTWVIVRRPAAGFEQRIAVDPQGRFELGGLTPGAYELSVTSPGFAPSVLRVVLAGGDTRRVHFTLRVGALSEDVVVLAQEMTGSQDRLRRLPGSVDIIDFETLASSHPFTTNEALRKVPGLVVRDEEGFGLRPNIGIRGLNPTRSSKVLLLEDGIPLAYAPYGDNASYYHPPIDRFDRIEVLKGGAQIAYGPQTVGGAINYVTPMPPSRPSGSLTLVGGNRDYFNGHANYGSTRGRTGYLFDYMRKQGNGSRENINSKLNDVNGKVVRTFGGDQTLTARGNYYSEDSNVTYSGLRQAEYEANPRGNPFRNDFFFIDRFGTSATHAYSVTGNLALTTNLYFTSFRRHWWRQSSNSGQRPNDASDPACGGMANLSTTCGNEGRLRQYYTWGIEPRARLHHGLLGARSETDFGVRAHFETQDRLQENGDTPTARTGLVVENNLRRSQAYSMFVQNRLFLEGWTITPGVRVEHVRFRRTNRLANSGTGVTGMTELTRFVPGIGVSHSTNERVTIFAGVHRGFAPPRTEDLVTNTGGVVDLDPELSWNYELGFRSTPRSGIRVDATFFRMDYENQIVPASLAGGVGATLTNGGETLHQGVEVSARADSSTLFKSTHNAYVRASYTYLPIAQFSGVRFSSVSGFGTVSISGNRLPYAPERLATVGFGYAHPSGFDAQFEIVHTSDQFGDDLNTVAPAPDGQRGLLEAYTVWNAGVNYQLGPSTLFVAVKNLLDDLFIVDRVRGILPGSPRLVQAGVRLKW
jgi:Fe(3+) dicitrate transport protein